MNNMESHSQSHQRRPSSPLPTALLQQQNYNHHHHHSRPSQPQLFTQIPPSVSLPLRTSHNTPVSSPGLFSPTGSRNPLLPPPTSLSESTSPAPEPGFPYLHPLQSTYRVRETHKALIESDNITGRKLINQYEVIEEIGRGMHGKVKLARNLETGENVAIKIIPRFSKKRRLGKVTAKSPQDKTKKEIAILKKIRHPNVVALLEVIDDPELKKIYMVLEHAELGEVIWRKKGLPHIYQYERRRAEREMRGEQRTAEEEKYDHIIEQRQAIKDWKRTRMAQNFSGPSDYWSVEYGAADESSSYGQQSRIPSREDFALSDGAMSQPGSRPPSRGLSQGPSRSHSSNSMCVGCADLGDELLWDEDLETPGPLRSNPNSSSALDGSMYGAYHDNVAGRGRRPSVADSIISHMSSVDYFPQTHDSFADDFSYVPCFTLDQARATFRDTVLGLEYLHYQGVVHRDIKPANLLWSKDHRVKISDFGVSYFGRPIRDGELGETVSESEARDFDDDLELAKTVGTPAFFAPELCYTDVTQEQPKVSEQIDVWSLGVTLYCLIFARIPFMAEDEFQMFRKIATEDVYIPRQRLAPVDPSTSPMTTSLYKRHNRDPYRDDNDLIYEDVDPLLYDLLRLMLTKNPEQRIRLRDIKRHPWVVQGLANPVGWLDDTDPGGPSSGRKIQVNERDVSDAVVPLTFLERARSAVKKAVGKVIHPLVDRGDSRTRRRAASSVASSSGDTSMFNGPPTQYPREERRPSLKPEDYFAIAIKDGLASRESGPSESSSYDPLATVLPFPDDQDQFHTESADQSQNSTRQASRSRATSKVGLHLRNRSSRVFESQTTPTTPACARENEYMIPTTEEDSRLARSDCPCGEHASRSRSVDRGLFGSTDKRASPRVGVTPVVAPGDFQRPTTTTPRHPRAMRSVDLGRKNRLSLASPLATSVQSAVTPENEDEIDFERETTSQPSRSRQHTQSSVASSFRGQLRGQQPFKPTDPASIPLPSSDGEEAPRRAGPTRGNTMTTVKSSSTESIDGLGTPLTCPSEVTSPTSTQPPTKNASEQGLVFQSDPSLPALLSGASSVSADMEAELVNRPALVSTRPSLLETTDSLTPPAQGKEPAGGFPVDQVLDNPPAMESASFSLRIDEHPGASRSNVDDDDDDDDDGSDDDILIMAKSNRKSVPTPVSFARRAPFEARRRDTNISTTSTETAKPPTVESPGFLPSGAGGSPP